MPKLYFKQQDWLPNYFSLTPVPNYLSNYTDKPNIVTSTCTHMLYITRDTLFMYFPSFIDDHLNGLQSRYTVFNGVAKTLFLRTYVRAVLLRCDNRD